MRLVVYSKKGCPFCSLLKNQLTTRGISFESFDLSDNGVRDTFYLNTGTKSVPQVYLTDAAANLTYPSGKALGGWDTVSKLLGSLKEMLTNEGELRFA